MAQPPGSLDQLWKPRRVLSLDGGGVRGLSAIMIVRAVMEQVNDSRTKKGLSIQQPWEYFDMIGGTSTGGIIAVMLGRLRMSVEQCENAYRKLSSDIFAPKRSSWNIFGRGKDFLTADGKFDANALERAIKSVIEDQLPSEEAGNPSNGNKYKQNADDIDFLDGDPACQVFVTTAFRDTSTPIILRTYKNEKKYDAISRDMKVWEACRATSAASTFFEPFKHAKQDLPFVDGAVRWNNPIKQAWIEARDVWPEDENRTIFLSIGTGYDPYISLEGGVSSLLKGIVKLATDTENEAQEFYDLHRDDLVEGKRYFRLNVPGVGDVGLDEHAEFSQIRQKTYHYLGENASAKLKDCCSALEVQVILSPSEESLLTDYEDTRAMAAVDSQRQWDDTADCAKGTFKWFPENTTYQSWKRSTTSMVLLITAEAGCGKTVLAKHLSLHLGTIDQPPMPCCYFFFHSRNEHSTVANTLFTMLCYLLESPLVHPEYLKFVLRRHHSPASLIKRGEGYLYDLICKAAPHMHCGASPFSCILDALDECKDPERLIKLLHDNNTEFPFKLAITTREIIDNPRWKSSSIINLNDYQDFINDDIRTVIKKNVEELDIDTGEDKKASLERDAVAQAGETFLWQASFFAEIRLMSTSAISNIQDLLKDTPSSVRDCYERILERRPHLKTTSKILNIIVASARPLSLDEFNVTLGVTMDEPTWDVTWQDVSRRLESSSKIESFLKHHCGSLLKIRNGTVVVFHQTVKDFLLSSKVGITLEGANRCLAMGCINYLLLEDWNGCSIKLKGDFFAFVECCEGFPRFFNLPLRTTDRLYSMTCFYDYSARHWFQHVENALSEREIMNAFLYSNDTAQCDLLIQRVKTLCSPTRGRLATSIPAFTIDAPLLFSLRIRCLPLILGILCQTSHALLKEQFGSQPLHLAVEKEIPAVIQIMLNHSDKDEQYIILFDALRHAIKFQRWSMSEFILNLSQNSIIEKRALHLHVLACAMEQDKLEMIIPIIALKNDFDDFLPDLLPLSGRRRLSVFEFIIRSGFNFSDNTLSTALLQDCIRSKACVRVLLQSGVITTIQHLRPDANNGDAATLTSAISKFFFAHCIKNENFAFFSWTRYANEHRGCWSVFKVLLETAMFFWFSNSEHQKLKALLVRIMPIIVQSKPELRIVLIALALDIQDQNGEIIRTLRSYVLGNETIKQLEEASSAAGEIYEITWRKTIRAALLNVNKACALHNSEYSPESCDPCSIAFSNFSHGIWAPVTDEFGSRMLVQSEVISDLSMDCIKTTAFLFDLPETTVVPILLLLTNRYSIESVLRTLRGRGMVIHFFRKTRATNEAADAASLFENFLAQLSAPAFESIARHLSHNAPELAFAHERYNGINMELVLPCASKDNRPLAREIIAKSKTMNSGFPEAVFKTTHRRICAGDHALFRAPREYGRDELVNSARFGKTPLMKALLPYQSEDWLLAGDQLLPKHKMHDTTKLLLSYGADPWLDLGKGQQKVEIGGVYFDATSSAVSIAARGGNLQYMIGKWQRDPLRPLSNYKGQELNSGSSMLHLAVRNYLDLMTVKYLLVTVQVDPKNRARSNRSAIHHLVAILGYNKTTGLSVEENIKPLVELLIAGGSEINGLDDFGLMSIHLPPLLCHHQSITGMLEVLISAGADYGWLEDEPETDFSAAPYRVISLHEHSERLSRNISAIKYFFAKRRGADQRMSDQDLLALDQDAFDQLGPRRRSTDEWQQEIIRNFRYFSSGLDRNTDILSDPCEEIESSHDEIELPDWEAERMSDRSESIPDTQGNIQEGSETDTVIQEHVQRDQRGREQLGADNMTFYGDFY